MVLYVLEVILKFIEACGLLHSRLSGCHATLPQKLGRCVTARKTAAKDTLKVRTICLLIGVEG